MGSGVSTLIPCFKPAKRTSRGHHRSPDHHRNPSPEPIYSPSEPLDGTLGNSFCYFRSSNRLLSPTPSDRFVSPSGSFRFSPSHEPARIRPTSSSEQQTGGFRAISGASVGANTSTPRTVLNLDNIYDEAADSTFGGCAGYGVKSSIVNSNGFEGTSSFSALPLQPVPRATAGGEPSGPLERSGFFMSGPIERGAMSGPLDSAGPIPGGPDSDLHFSAPLGGVYKKKKRKKRKKSLTWYPNFGERKQRPWVVPVLNFVSGRKDLVQGSDGGLDDAAERARRESDLQWALGKAGEDRVHVVVSEEQGWLFVGIYDGFNGPDAPEFLMGNLYRAIYSELQGLFWELDEKDEGILEETNEHNRILTTTPAIDNGHINRSIVEIEQEGKIENVETSGKELICEDDSSEKVKSVAIQSGITESGVRRRLWELLAEAEAEDGLDLSGSKRFAFSVDDAVSVSLSKSESVASKRWLSFSNLKKGLSKHKEGLSGRRLFPRRFNLDEREKEEEGNAVERAVKSGNRRKVGEIEHESVLRAMSKALEATELAFLDMTDKVLDSNPELALMGSCLLAVLMRDEDVYVMNVGDSRAIVGQYQVEEIGSSVNRGARERNHELSKDGISVESCLVGDKETVIAEEASSQSIKLTALQLSTDHSTSIEDEIVRIKNEHPDDSQCIVNDRVKGRLKVTRAFGAGFLKQPKLNDALLEMFRNDYIGTAPYVSCTPSLRHHRLGQKDQFLVLSSDGLYQYLSNLEVVALVENFFQKFPDGDPAQHLIEEVLVRAAKKAGMDFHELLDIPQGDRRKYHDDVTVMVVSLEGRIWKSSGKYP